MNALALTAEPTLAAPKAVPALPGVLHVKVLKDLAAAKVPWLDLERDGISTPYQHFAWVSCWYECIGKPAGVKPHVVLGEDMTGRAVFLLPLGSVRIGPLTVARFMGGKHSNANLGLWRRDYAASFTGERLASLLAEVGKADASVDLLVLLNQPESWGGIANPLASAPSQPSPSFMYRGPLAESFDDLMRDRVSSSTRKKLRQKERALSKHGEVRYWRAEAVADRRRVLDAFFAQKAERMRELGLPNAFEEPHVRQFIEAVALRDPAHPAASSVALFAASAGDTIVATFAGLESNGRLSGMFNSMISGELAHHSPGELLLANVVRFCCERGMTTFDLGIGEAHYKKTFCSEAEPLFDSIVPLSMLGRTAASLWRSYLSVKGGIKRSAPAWRVVAPMRRRLAGGLHLLKAVSWIG